MTLCFFFFQAEDGIRDIGVTGVQTCALPILTVHRTRPLRGFAEVAAAARARPDTLTYGTIGNGSLAHLPMALLGRRSEERRVGEEGRSRGSPYHLKKKKTVQQVQHYCHSQTL